MADESTDAAHRPMIVAIDGPAGAGKSTIAKSVAVALGIPHLDTGAMYRSVTWAALRDGLDVNDDIHVAELARSFACSISPERVVIDGVDATAGIRSPEVTANVSAVAANPEVRTILRDRQRAWAIAAGGGVMEGRDIGTVVFPDAAVKVFLTASIEERARRRAVEAGLDYDEVVSDMRRRDEADSTREHAPLVRAEDAIEVDTTDMSPTEAVDAIVALTEQAGDPATS